MSTFSVIVAFSMPVICLFFAILVGFKTMKSTRNARKAFSRHLITLVCALAICSAFTVMAATADSPTAVETAETTAIVATGSGAGIAAGLGFIGAALSVGLAAIGAGVALSAGAPAAIGAVSEDPKSFGKSMIFVVLGEAVAIYGFIIAFMIIMKIPNLPQL